MFEEFFEDGIGAATTWSETVQCSCNTLFRAQLTHTVDAADTELAQLARNGMLHRVRCPACNTAIMIDAPFMFHDAEAQLFTIVLPETWRHRALEARCDFIAALAEAADQVIPGYINEAPIVFGLAELLGALGEPARRATDHRAARSGVRGVDELVEQVVDEMIEEVVETPAGSARESDEAVVLGDEDIEEITEEEPPTEEAGAEAIEVDDSLAVEELPDISAMSDDELLALLENPEHRREAALALISSDARRHIEPILVTFGTLHEPDRARFLPAVLRLGEAAVPFLIKSLEGEDDVAARSAARALSAMRAPGAMEALRARLSTRLSGRDADAYCFALAAFGAAGREALGEELENTSWVVRSAAVRALARTCGPECREAIEALASDRSARVRRAVREALDSLQRFADGGPTGEGPL